MKGKAEARRVVEKPVAFKTEADLVNACEWCEQRQVELGQRVKIFPETFNPRIRVQRMMALLWASQVKQDENGVCDSPYLQVLESRCRSHVKSQVEDYSSTLHVATIAVDAAEQLCASVGGEVVRSEQAAKQEPEVDLSATDGLSEADRNAVASHDSDVVRARKKAALAAAEARRDELTALLNRARRIQTLLAESMERNMAYCQNHFREQALSHLRWSHKRAGLNRPYVLPGVLEKLPDIQLSELADSDKLAGLANGEGGAEGGAGADEFGFGDASSPGCNVSDARAGEAPGSARAGAFAPAAHVGEGVGAGKLGSAGDAADVAVAAADAAAGIGAFVDAHKEGAR